MTATILYEGNLHCNAVHVQSNSSIETDAPTDNRGKGERFSPTDLLCTSLATCMITTMALKATDMGIELKGATADIQKHMESNPRRIAKIEVHVKFNGLADLDEKSKIILQNTGDHCPVIKSLHPDMEVDITYQWL
ncbi:MAG: OsmC family protein [Ferruginibacter sp.]